MRELRNAHAAAAHIELPPMVEAFEAPIGELSVREPRRAVRTPIVQASERALVVAEEDEPFAVDRKGNRTLTRQIFEQRDWIPAIPPLKRGPQRHSVRRGLTQQT